jgi:hypothetical protein
METLASPEKYPTPARATVNLLRTFRNERHRRRIGELVDQLPSEASSEDGRVDLVSDRASGQTRINIHGHKGPASFDQKTIDIQRTSWGSVTDIRLSVAYADDMGIRTHTNEYAYSADPPGSDFSPEAGVLSLREVAKDIRFALAQVAD